MRRKEVMFQIIQLLWRAPTYVCTYTLPIFHQNRMLNAHPVSIKSNHNHKKNIIPKGYAAQAMNTGTQRGPVST